MTKTLDSVLTELSGLVDTKNLTPQSYVIDLEQNPVESNIQEIIDTFTRDQRTIFDLVSNRFERKQQFLMSIIVEISTRSIGRFQYISQYLQFARCGSYSFIAKRI